MADNFEQRCQDLEAQHKALKLENERLKEYAKDVLLLGLVAEGISAMDAVDSILQYTLERISLLMELPYCVFCELLGNEAIIISSHRTSENDDFIKDAIVLPQAVIESLEQGTQIYAGDELAAQGIALTPKGSSFIPLRVLLLPFSARLIRQGVLIVADRDSSQNKLSPNAVLFKRILEIVISRLDNLSLVQELQHLNLALNMEVDRRSDKLRETNEQLRETMLQRLRVEDALLRQRDITSNISEASPVGIIILDTQGQITYANARAETVLGLSKKQITDRQYNAPDWKITDYDGNPFPENELPFAKVMATGQPVYNVRHAIEWPDDKRILLAINAAPLYNDAFRLDGVVAVLDDVTAEITADAEFQRLQTFNTHIVQNISEGIVMEDVEGKITFVNPATAKILGYGPEELMGKPASGITPQDQHEVVDAANERRKQGQSDRYELNILCRDGSQIPVLVSASPRFDARSGEFLGSLAVFTDITERKDAERRLHESEERYRGLSEATFEAIFISKDGICLEQNAAAERMFGYTLAEAVGEHGTEWIVPDDRDLVNRHMLSGYEEPYEATALRKDGTTFPAEIRGRAAQYKGEKVRVTALRDITGRKEAEELNRIQHDLALQLSAVTGLDAILQLCLEIVIHRTTLDAGGIYLVDKSTGDIHLASSIGLSPGFLEKASFYAADAPNVQRMMLGEPDYIRYSDLNLPSDDFRIQEGIQSVASMPIKFEGQIIAFFNMASLTTDTVQQSTKNIIEAISTKIGSAVARAQTEERLRQRVDQLALINDIGEKIAAVLDLETVLFRTARLIQENFNYEHVALFIIDQQSNAAVMKTCSGALKKLFPAKHTLKLGQGLVGTAALQNETILVNDVEADPRYVNLYPEIVHTRAELSVPVQIGREVVGVIDAQSVQRNAFTESDVMVMETLADQVAVAIHNANLHEAVQKELAERARIETALRESEKKFRNIVESSPMGMHMYQLEPDDRLVFLDANPTANLILGVDCQQFIGKTIDDAFPALMETEIPTRYRQVAATGKPWHIDQIDYDENGISGAFGVYAFQTETNRMAVFFLDITERKRAEDALRRSEKTLSSIFRAAPTGIGLVSDHVLTQVNELIYKMSGYSREELLGQNARILYPTDEDYEYVEREKYRQINQLGTGTVETRWQHKDGHIIDVLMSSTPIDPDDLTVGVTFTALDITERKRAEVALRHSENTLSSIFRVAPTGIGLVVENEILQVNQRVCEMTAYEKEEILGQNIRIIFPTDQHYEYFTREMKRQIEESGSGTIETRWLCKDGQIIDVFLSVMPIDPDDLGMGLTFTALDITERKQAEARIQRQMRRLAALNQIDAAITGNIGLDRTIDILLEQSVRQLNVDAAAILLYQPDSQTLEYYAGQGFNTEAITDISLGLGQEFAGRAALERQTVYATDADPEFLKLSSFVAEGIRCYYGVPLVAKGQIKGVLEIFHHCLLEPTEGWMSFLETLAGQAAIAIDGAELVGNLERSNLELRLAYNTTLEGWAKALELRDFETQGHSHRVTELTLDLATKVGMPNNELIHVHRGALLHDIGKMAVPDHILLKNGPLDDDEWEIMRQHPVYAYEMLSSIEFLRPALDIPYYHHEKWDGSGYPQGLKGEDIPLAARVFAIIDVWDALSSNRPYREARPKAEVLAYIRSQVGTHFDPRVAEAFFSIIQPE